MRVTAWHDSWRGWSGTTQSLLSDSLHFGVFQLCGWFMFSFVLADYKYHYKFLLLQIYLLSITTFFTCVQCLNLPQRPRLNLPRCLPCMYIFYLLLNFPHLFVTLHRKSPRVTRATSDKKTEYVQRYCHVVAFPHIWVDCCIFWHSDIEAPSKSTRKKVIDRFSLVFEYIYFPTLCWSYLSLSVGMSLVKNCCKFLFYSLCFYFLLSWHRQYISSGEEYVPCLVILLLVMSIANFISNSSPSKKSVS